MEYTDLGNWGPAERHVDPDSGQEFSRYTNAAGEDFYQTIAHNPESPSGLYLALDDTGRVRHRGSNNSALGLDPANSRVIVVDPAGIDFGTLFGKRFDFDIADFMRIVDNTSINNERSRREQVGTTINIDGYGPVPIQGRPDDKSNMQALAFGASLRQQAGIEQDTQFRDANNVDHMLSNSQVIELYAKGVQWMENVYKASWAIKAMDPLPQDYDADSYWPAT